ncbi:hypothetical protein M885DRAFT_508539 [Pelagophyceae sp. CCMP2097]|nr:hypothetical protein M885DRAFT_508539 [Pelagophyceae sp. CCMP2097]
MGFPTIEASEVGGSGLLWLFLSYGGVLFYASNLISEGSELLLLVPSLAGIVGSCVLPVLGAVPDGAIMLFSGMGSREEAQANLAVGVGALAGSTIMLLTIPFGAAILAGRVDLDANGEAHYKKRPKLSAKAGVASGVTPGRDVRTGAVVMALTTLAYSILQVPALFIAGDSEAKAFGERGFALFGLVWTLGSFVAYLVFQVKSARSSEMQKAKVDEIIKLRMLRGEISLAGALGELLVAGGGCSAAPGGAAYGGVGAAVLDADATSRLAGILRPFYLRYDTDRNDRLDYHELGSLYHDVGESLDDGEVQALMREFDLDNSGDISFDEFVLGIAAHIAARYCATNGEKIAAPEDDEGDDEEETPPEDMLHLSPAQQQTAIKKRALIKLLLGTTLVVVFSDPMVDVMSEIGVRTGVPPFYVSFVLAPLASNASELIASYFYALKKTSKSITISFAALEGAACMNNTFCLAIFCGLVHFKGLAWSYSAETLAIVLVQWLVASFALKKTLTPRDALCVFAIYPLSLILVAGLEAAGLD